MIVTPGEYAAHDNQYTTAQAELLLRDEFAQAWNHFRHLEVLRSQYLSFAFSITLALLAGTVPLVITPRYVPEVILLAAGIGMIYALIVGSLYLSIRKIRHLLRYFQRCRGHWGIFLLPRIEPSLRYAES